MDEDTGGPRPAETLPMPLRLWELILLQATFAGAIGVYVTIYAWMGDVPRGTRWLMAFVSAMRAAGAVLALEESALGPRGRWNRWGRAVLLLLPALDGVRLPALATAESATVVTEWSLQVGLFVLVAANFPCRTAAGRKRWGSLWGWLPALLWLAHPFLVGWVFG